MNLTLFLCPEHLHSFEMIKVFWMPRKAGGYNKPEELDCEESGLCINQMKPLASKLFVSVNENPIQDPINVAHKCLIQKKKTNLI